jgi:hypothetical protein
MKCEICGEEFKNLGVHMRVHKATPDYSANVIVDVPTDKRLSELVDAMKDLLRPYQNKITVCYEEEGGQVKSIEFTARIQLRR